MTTKKETGYGCLFLIGILLVHNFIWQDYDIPPEAVLPFFLISGVITLAILGILSWIINLIKPKGE